MACKPGFKPTLGNTTPNNIKYKYITSCDYIPNCLSSLEYNKCQQCKSGFVLKYHSEGGAWKTFSEECVANSIEGC